MIGVALKTSLEGEVTVGDTTIGQDELIGVDDVTRGDEMVGEEEPTDGDESCTMLDVTLGEG
ncbi:hypothetical protein KI387_008973, partial [Taxus chinensis]